MILNPRGTSGSGKSTVVRRLLPSYLGIQQIFEDGRRQPIATMYSKGLNGARPLFVPGHYNTACGGCDTIKTPDKVYELIRAAVKGEGCNVIFEGIIIQDDTRRLLELNAENPVNVIELSTPIEQCLAGIQSRRDARKDERPLNPKNTVGRAVRVHKICDKLRAGGLTIPYLDRDAAYLHCRALLGLS